jgi:hypothetical protein
MKTCPECGEQLADDARHCGHCGEQLEKDDSAKKTQFGLGSVSPDQLDDVDLDGDEGDSTSSGGGVGGETAGGDDGPRLPTPGEIGGGESGDIPGDDSVSDDVSDTSPVGLKGSDDEDDEGEGPAYAKTATMEPIEEGEEDGGSGRSLSVEEGRLDSPDEGSSEVSSGPSLQDDEPQPEDDHSPFASGTGTGSEETAPPPSETDSEASTIESTPDSPAQVDTGPAEASEGDTSDMGGIADEPFSNDLDGDDDPATSSEDLEGGPSFGGEPETSDDSGASGSAPGEVAPPDTGSSSEPSFEGGIDAQSEPGSADDLEVADVGRDEPTGPGGPGGAPADEPGPAGPDTDGGPSSPLAEDDRFGSSDDAPPAEQGGETSPSKPSPNTPDDDKIAGIDKTYVYIIGALAAFSALACAGGLAVVFLT